MASGAGGKIVRNRREQRLASTPYDRPPPPLKSPNWFTGVVVRAGKILSSIFTESESEEDDSPSDDGIGHDNQSSIPSYGVNTLNEYGLEPQSSVWRSETKRIIEQLIKQETFSREECGKLIEVLNSRVIDWSTEAREKSSLASPGKTIGHEDVDIYDKAVQEAKKWFQEKKVGSSSVIEPAHDTCNLNSTRLEYLSEGGSPIDVARSYMKEKPPWASPTRNVELRTPLATMKLFKEGTSYLVGRDSLSSSKKRSSFASGSWNIHEELRKVRSKATDDMLRTLSSKTDPSMFTAGPVRVEPLGATAPVFGVGGRMIVAESLRKIKPINVLVDAGVSSDPALAALKSIQVGKEGDAEPSKPVTSVAANEVSEVAQADGGYAAIKFPHSSIANYTEERHNDPDLRKTNGAGGTTDNEFGRKQSVNGLSSSQTSKSAGVIVGQNHEHRDEVKHNADTVNEKQPVNIIDVEDNCELLSEAYMEVPIVTETDSLPSGSQNSLGVQNEEPSLDMTQPSPKEKQGKQSGKYKGRSRGRGK